MKKLYNNIGSRLCKIALVVGAIGLIVSAIGIGALLLIMLGVIYQQHLLVAGIAAIVGVVCLFLSWPLYAFGQITDDVRSIKNFMVNHNFPIVNNSLPVMTPEANATFHAVPAVNNYSFNDLPDI